MPYLDEDLTTGTQDGSSWANAYRSWSAMVTGEATTLSADLDIFVRSLGTVSAQRALNAADGWVVGVYVLSIIGDTANVPILYFSAGFGRVLITDLDNVVTENIIHDGANRCLEVSGSGVIAITCVYMNAADEGVFKTGDTGAGGVITLNNCIFVNNNVGVSVAGFRHMTCINCYVGNNTTIDYEALTNGVLTLTTSASSDLTGSAGLQSVPYSTATFTNVTAGTEDFHLVTGSGLIAEGTITAYTEDIAGDSWGSPQDIGIYVFVSAGGVSIPVVMNQLRNQGVA